TLSLYSDFYFVQNTFPDSETFPWPEASRADQRFYHFRHMRSWVASLSPEDYGTLDEVVRGEGDLDIIQELWNG
ncbi:hypothetical protein BGZ47_002485, partial [Haplosporangium gracile]